jgi:hypothetical protein
MLKTRNLLIPFPAELPMASTLAATAGFLSHFGAASRSQPQEIGSRGSIRTSALRLTAERMKNLSALSGVAYEKSGAIFLL